MKAGIVAVLCAVLAMQVAAATEKPPQVRLDAIRVQFLYEKTGTLSEDVAPPSQFSIWNTIIGEGSAREPANDVLVSVVLRSASAEANVDAPLSVTVKGPNGHVLAKRTISNIFVKGGTAVRSLFVQDAACAGDLQIDAVLGRQRKTTKVSMNCGE